MLQLDELDELFLLAYEKAKLYMIGQNIGMIKGFQTIILNKDKRYCYLIQGSSCFSESLKVYGQDYLPLIG